MAQNLGINSIVNLGVPASVPDEFTIPEVRSAVELFLSGQQNLFRVIEQYLGISRKDITLWPTLVPSDTLLSRQLNRYYAVTNIAIAFGEFVNITDVAGVATVRLASAAAATLKPAHGYCSTPGGVALGELGEFILIDGIVPITGVVSGTHYYLSSAAQGAISSAKPAAAGTIVQPIGFGVATDLLKVNILWDRYVQN